MWWPHLIFARLPLVRLWGDHELPGLGWEGDGFEPLWFTPWSQWRHTMTIFAQAHPQASVRTEGAPRDR